MKQLGPLHETAGAIYVESRQYTDMEPEYFFDGQEIDESTAYVGVYMCACV